jgi:hypothetical protein
MGHFRLPRVTIDDRHNAKGRDKHGEELARLPVELEELYCDDVGEEGVRVPDRSDIAEPIVRVSQSHRARAISTLTETATR